MTKLYRIKQFSEMTSVTVRSLQYYDTLGILKPTSRTASGHRLYSDIDVLQLHQVMTLKLMGLTLKQIQTLLINTSCNADRALELQHDVILLQAEQLRKAEKLLQQAQINLRQTGQIDSHLIAKMIAVLQMKDLNDYSWLEKYYCQST